MAIAIMDFFPKAALAAGLALAVAAGPALAEQVVYSFQKNGADGVTPIGSLIYAGGVFYGTTPYGGAYDEGAIFSVTADGTETVLHSFGAVASDGAEPQSGLLAVDGTLYGTTYTGGKYEDGTVFRVKPDGTEQVLHAFSGSDGEYPFASLVDVNGTLYGTAESGGAYGFGVVFSIAPDGSETILHSFANGSDGCSPLAPLLYLNGTLYGITNTGGTYNDGTVFALTLGGAETVLHSFGVAGDGTYPEYGGLTSVNGVLYGDTTQGGDHDEGVVFSITTAGAEQILYTFNGTNGALPFGGLVNVNGVLYGTAAAGTPRKDGAVFSITPSGVETLLFAFAGLDGVSPEDSMIVVGSSLYGTTLAGGANGVGTVFKMK